MGQFHKKIERDIPWLREKITLRREGAKLLKRMKNNPISANFGPKSGKIQILISSLDTLD
jgi:hypothetical protein